MDGLTTLRALAPPRPRAVVLAPDTLEGGRAAWDALRMGARDLLSKRTLRFARGDREASRICESALRGVLFPCLPRPAPRIALRGRPAAPGELSDRSLLFLLVETGRLLLAARLLRHHAQAIACPVLLEVVCPPRVTRAFCEGLDRMAGLPVRVAVRDERPAPRQILLVPGGWRARIARRDGPIRLDLERTGWPGDAEAIRRRTLRHLLDPESSDLAVAISRPAMLSGCESRARQAIERRRLFHLAGRTGSRLSPPHLRTATSLRFLDPPRQPVQAPLGRSGIVRPRSAARED